jgi:hypothetical protein
MAGEIGLQHGAPDNSDSVWEAWINDRAPKHQTIATFGPPARIVINSA